MGATIQCVEKGGCGCSELGKNLCGGGTGGSAVWVGNMGDGTAHWEGIEHIPPQGVPQADGKLTSEKEVQ